MIIARIEWMLLLMATMASSITVPPARAGSTTERVSIGTGGAQADLSSYGPPGLSADGRFVAFTSEATNLVPGDTNNFDVFVRDRKAGTTELISIATDGERDSAFSGEAAMSANGRYVAFYSEAANLVPNDTNGAADIFVRDRKAGTTERMSVASDGTQANSSSARAAISADGRYVAFASEATNLVPNDTNGVFDVFVHGRKTGRTEQVSVTTGGVGANGSSGFDGGLAISADGRFVAFASEASNLVPGDTNGERDVFLRDLKLGRTTRVSIGPNGRQARGTSEEPALSADGRFVAFDSSAANLVPDDTGAYDVFVRDRKLGRTTRVSVSPKGRQANDGSFDPVLSANGRFVAFVSVATNLIPGGTNGMIHVFLRDRKTDKTELVSVGRNGQQANAESGFNGGLGISIDGCLIAFSSEASNLVPNDTNGTRDVFIRHR